MTPERRREASRQSLENRLANAWSRANSRVAEILRRCPMTRFSRRDCQLTRYPGMTPAMVRQVVQAELLTLRQNSHEIADLNQRWP